MQMTRLVFHLYILVQVSHLGVCLGVEVGMVGGTTSRRSHLDSQKECAESGWVENLHVAWEGPLGWG